MFTGKAYQDKLDEIIADLQPMDIIVTRDRTPISWWIRMKTNSDWSHVCLAGQHGTIFTTAPTRYSLVNARKYLNGKSFAVYRHGKMTKEIAYEGLMFNYALIDTPYAYSDIIRMTAANLKGRAVTDIKNHSQNVFCAEAVCATFRMMMLPLVNHLKISCSAMTPQRCVEDVELEEIHQLDR